MTLVQADTTFNDLTRSLNEKVVFSMLFRFDKGTLKSKEQICTTTRKPKPLNPF